MTTPGRPETRNATWLPRTAAGSGTSFRVVALVLVVAFGLVGAGCGGDGVDRGAAGSGTGSSSTDVWTVEERFVVGPVEGRPETDFSYVADVALRADTVFVLDQPARAVRVFAADGRLLRTVGGPGDGPGELSRFAASLLLVGDTLTVVDWGRGSAHRFLTDGSFMDAPSIRDTAARSWWRRGADGETYARSLERFVDDEGSWRGRDRLLRVGPLASDAQPVFGFTYGETDLGGPGRPALPLLVNAPSWDVLGDGRIVWTTLQDTVVRLHRADGTLEREIHHPSWVRRAPRAEAEATFLQLMGDKLVSLGGSRATVEQLDVALPERLPAITTVRAGPGGSLWVQRFGSVADIHPMALNSPDPPTGWGGALWDVLDLEGALLATVDVGPRVRITGLEANRLVGVRRDELGRESVVVWSISR